MPQPDPASITWARLVKEAVPEGPASHLEVVTCVERSGNVEVVFHGTGSFKNELFGVRIPILRAIGDDDWRQTVGPNPGRTGLYRDAGRLGIARDDHGHHGPLRHDESGRSAHPG